MPSGEPEYYSDIDSREFRAALSDPRSWAWDRLVDIVWVRVFAFACAVASSRDEAEEHARGAFSALFQRLAAGKPTAVDGAGAPRPLLPYLLRIVHNSICDAYRGKARRRESQTQHPEGPVLHVDVAETMAWMEMGEPVCLEAILDVCTPRERDVLMLHCVWWLPIEQTAAVLGIRVGAAQRALRRGLRRIRQSASTSGTLLGIHDREQA